MHTTEKPGSSSHDGIPETARAAAPAAELQTTSDALRRYQMPGPHLTAIVRIPVSGTGNDSIESRWHPHAVQLRHRHAPTRAIDQLERLLYTLPPDGRTVLITANRNSAAYRGLSRDDDQDRDAAVVGRLPRLVPVLADLAYDQPTLCALVDRVGADIFDASIDEIRPLQTVTGDDEFIHRSAQGGWSQRRFQTRAEQLWESNAQLVAASLNKLAKEIGSDRILLSGDVRACGFVLNKLHEELRWEAKKVDAGGRHEPRSINRIHEAATRDTTDSVRRSTERQLERLASELQIGKRAVRGLAIAVDDIVAGMVDTLFVADRIPSHDWFDFATQRALETGASIVVAPPTDERLGAGGIAAILRHSAMT